MTRSVTVRFAICLAGAVEDLRRAASERIVAQAEGIPLYAVETVRSLTERGVLTERDGRLMLAGEVGELDVPASLGRCSPPGLTA